MKKRFFQKRYTLIIILFAIFAFLFSSTGEMYRTYSPDGQYSVYASKKIYMKFMAVMPGSSGDSPGTVTLYDEIEKEIIGTGNIEMINLTPEINWRTNQAYYKGPIGTSWKLPRPIQNSKKKTIN